MKPSVSRPFQTNPDDTRVRHIISELLWAIRNDITNAVASEIGDMNRKIDLGNGARTMYSVTRNDCRGQIDTSVAPRDHPEKFCNIIRN